jgi:hypothetical protein
VGAKICEVPIQNIVRPTGKSKYGLSRTPRVLMDLLTVRFLVRYFTRPLHFMGLLALIFFFVGAGIELALVIEKARKGWEHFHIMQIRGPWMVIAFFLMITSVLFLISGLLGELIVRTYYESQGKHIYYVRRIHRKKAQS